MKTLLKYWPIFSLFILNIVLFITNYKSGTYLTGWDNLHPEFDPLMNIQRSIFAVWQEYQGLGLLGGMGHASDLIRQIYVLLLSIIIPNDLIRYISTFTALFLGSLGAYFLTKYILRNGQLSMVNGQLSAMLASLFYTLNIATIQTFYAPYESFIYHFAALPWLILSSILFLEKPSLGRTARLSLILLLAAGAAYIPTLFVVYILAISLYISVNFILTSNRISYLFTSIKLFIIVFLVNAFWLLPFLYFTINNSHITLNSKINQMGTETIFLQNKEFGTLLDTVLLRGFWFNNVDPNLEGNFDYMFLPWRQHFENVLVPAAGILLFVIILIGAISVLTKIRKSKLSLVNGQLSIAVLFLFAFTMLAIDTPVFSFVNELFRKIPLFEQAFRFPFTKFNSLAALTYSIMLAIGINSVIGSLFSVFRFLSTRFQFIRPKDRQPTNQIPTTENRKLITGKTIISSAYIIPVLLILFIAWPVFNGHLFYDKARINIPQEYFDTFAFFKDQDPSTRIANLPQPTFWGWTFYRWGYGGSGFLWYGIKQPILDRAFDVWSKTSENYYYELAHALYSEDTTALENVLDKYQITWILLDKNVIYPHSPGSLFYGKTENILSRLPNVSGSREFGNIKIYKVDPDLIGVDLAKIPKSFVFTANSNLPSAQVPFWKTQDPAYQNLGNYISRNCQLSMVNGQLFPFGSLFTQKTAKETDFNLINEGGNIRLEKEITLTQDSFLNIPSFLTMEKIIPVEIQRIKRQDGSSTIFGNIQTPKILLNGQNVWGQIRDIPLFSLPKNLLYPLEINTNGLSKIVLEDDTQGTLGTTFLTASENNSILASGPNFNSQSDIQKDIFESLFTNSPTNIEMKAGTHVISINIPKVDDDYLSLNKKGIEAEAKNCGPLPQEKETRRETTFTDTDLNITTKNTSVCFAFYSDTLFHDTGFAVFPIARNITGRALHFWILNLDQNISPVDVFLASNDSLVIPPMEANGRGYSFHFDNISIGQDITRNIISGIEVYPIPSKFVTNISIGQEITGELPSRAEIGEVSHPNESFYIVKLTAESQQPTTTLVLSQSYDPGWRAYSIQNSKFKIQNWLNNTFPFLFGNEINEHVELNSWENAWLLNEERRTNNDERIVIVYLPQYLQYAGFVILIATFGVLLGRFLQKSLQKNA